MKFKSVGICAFTSDRRLSSNIYENFDNEGNSLGTYTIYTKGSDTSVIPLLDADAHEEDFDELLKFTAKENEDFSVEGLRCLYLAKGTIDQEIFNEW